eukprot:TRINITY_DN11753_c0_g2_i1.p2 TRINITY_DN11753_c0_g2~~TRINITY_DN11753_c0_g2_i1.p2  ORF type:complete len:105 (-),score=12.37 TRINITY_DN11753_c0_g2_i1:182-496(-)
MKICLFEKFDAVRYIEILVKSKFGKSREHYIVMDKFSDIDVGIFGHGYWDIGMAQNLGGMQCIGYWTIPVMLTAIFGFWKNFQVVLSEQWQRKVLVDVMLNYLS